MSFNVSAALRLELQPSRQRRLWRWFTHFIVIASLPMLPSLELSALVAIVAFLSLYLTRIEKIFTLLWRSDGQWCIFEDDHERAMQLVGIPFVQPWMVILPLRGLELRRRLYIVIFPDMITAHTFRRLRVRLRSRLPDVAVDKAE